ncbi:MAG: hypothetical protein AB1728_11045 [Bacteroidota bacterium]
MRQYFWAENSKHAIMIALSLFLLLFLNTFVIALPGISQHSSSLLSIVIIVSSVFIPMLFGKIFVPTAKIFFESSSSAGKLVLGIHGLIFVGIVQMLMYVHVSDFLLTEMFQGSHFGLHVTMIVSAGIYTLVGGLNAVLYANLLIAIFVVGGILFATVSTMLFNGQLAFPFQSAVRTGTEIFASNGSAESGALITGIGIVCMMVWIMWIELGMVHKQSAVRSDHDTSRSVLIAGIITAVTVSSVLLLYGAVPQSTAQYSLDVGIGTSLVAVSLLSGMIGLFALSFQSAASIIALHIYPVIKHRYSGEEQVLIGRLATVVFAFLSVLLLSFAKLSGNAVLQWYIDFLAFFTTPIVALFFLSIVFKKGLSGGLLFGFIVGEIYALQSFIVMNAGVEHSLFNSTSVYSIAIEILLVTLFGGFCIIRFSKSGVGQKLLLRIGITRPIP